MHDEKVRFRAKRLFSARGMWAAANRGGRREGGQGSGEELIKRLPSQKESDLAALHVAVLGPGRGTNCIVYQIEEKLRVSSVHKYSHNEK